MRPIHSVLWPHFDALAYFRRCDEREAFLSYVRQDRWTIIAWHPSRTIVGNTVNDLRTIEETIRARPLRASANVPFTGGAIGCIGYDLASALYGIESRLSSGSGDFPGALVHVYDHAVITDGTRTFVVGDDAFLRHAENVLVRPAWPVHLSSIRWKKGITFASYRRCFHRVKEAILRGDVYQLNLTYAWHALSPNDRRRLFAILLARHPAPFGAYLEHEDGALLSLSPEQFLSIDERRRVLTCPVKGTRPRSHTATQDIALRHELEHDPKERAELAMITDLLRNDLSLVSTVGSVKVEAEREIFATPSVWHARSRISSVLLPTITPFRALCRSLPGGSITGCPKRSAMLHIDALERERRGAYTGIVFTLSDSRMLDSSIVIRSLVSNRTSLSLGVGGGIVIDSDVRKEWEETFAKAAPLIAPLRDTECLWIDGRLEKIEPRHRSMLDPENPRIEGIFETMYARSGEVALIDRHLARLRRSRALTRLSVPRSFAGVRSAIVDVAARFIGTARIKVIATRESVLVYGCPLSEEATNAARGIAATIVPLERTLPQAKALPYAACARARKRAQRKGFGEALLMNRKERITEGAYANLFWVSGGILHTPREKILRGITREQILAIAAALKVPVVFRSPMRAELESAEECFLTSAIAGIVPVTRIDAVRVGRGRIGPVTHLLMLKYSDITKNGNARSISI